MPPNQGRPGGHQRSRNRWRGCPSPLRDRLKPEPFSSPSVQWRAITKSSAICERSDCAALPRYPCEEGKDAVPPGATRPAESESMEGRPRPAEGPTRDRLTLQLAISVRGQLQICNSAPLHAGPILPRSTRLAELYLARRGRLCTATGRDRSTGYSQ